MRFRELSDDRRLQAPEYDTAELDREVLSLRGEFDFLEVRGEGANAGVTGEGTIAQSLLADMDLSDIQLRPVSLTDVRLENVDLSNGSLQDATMHRVEVVRSRAIGLRLSLAEANDLYIESTNFDYGTIHIERVKRLAAFRSCSFRETEIVGDISNIIFDDCTFEGAEFSATRAKDTDLRTSSLIMARGLLSLRGARITQEQAISVADQLATEAGLFVNR